MLMEADTLTTRTEIYCGIPLILRNAFMFVIKLSTTNFNYCNVAVLLFPNVYKMHRQSSIGLVIFELRFFNVNPGANSGHKLAVSGSIFTIKYLVAEQIV